MYQFMTRDLVKPIAAVMFLSFYVALLVGCAAGPTRTNMYPSEALSGRSLFYTSVTNESWMSNQPGAAFFEWCDFKVKADDTDYPILAWREFEVSNCAVAEIPHDMNVAPGAIPGFLGYAIPSAAGAYAGHEIGKGLGRSGSTVNQTGGGATSSSSSVSGVINGGGGHK